ncbi:MAG: GGDEF domain-containing protein [Clostridia bacterium]|nr:GGDEF domain-containing protein [Clostridia bacterium]
MKNQKIKKILYTSAMIGLAILLVVSIVYFLSVIINFRADLTETTESLSQQMAKDSANEINLLLEKELDNCTLLGDEIEKIGNGWDDATRNAVEGLLKEYGANREHQKYVAEIHYYRGGQEFRCDTGNAKNSEEIASLEFFPVSASDRKSESVTNARKSGEPVFSGIYEGNFEGSPELLPIFVLWYPFTEGETASISGFMVYYKSRTFFENSSFYSMATEEDRYVEEETESDRKEAFTNRAVLTCVISRHESEWNDWVIDLMGKNSTDKTSFRLHGLFFDILGGMANFTDGVQQLQKGLDKTILNEPDAEKRQKKLDEMNCVTTISISSTKYAVATSPVPLTLGELTVVEIYDPAVIYRTSYNFMGQMEGALIFLGVIFISILIYLNYQRTHLRDKKELEEQIDSVSGCLTYRYFLNHSEELVDKNPTNRYAVLMLRVNYLQYLGQLYGDEIFLKVIRFVGEVFEKLLDHTETYGYISDSNFAVLLHYQEEVELMNRLRMIHAIIYNFPELKSKNNHVKVTFGVYLVRPGEKYSTLQCLEKAGMALRSSSFSSDSLFRFYNDELGAGSNRQAEIELKMETSLQNDEFKVFYQPKYNLKKETIDSAEALVRWYDPELHRYYPPADFIPLFEENGFIVKLDHYVFESVCRFAADRIKEGLPLAPISVNASRVTAAEPDFVRYYLSVKRKYDVPNNLLTLEFTESTAMDNYEILRKIVADLKKGGIGSSVDDFGSGFSSYSILKELKMDELKLDRFFITAGIDAERDDALLNSVIKLGQKLGMKVTQEGVESVEMMDRLRRAGCNTIQGYYYSRPITQEDFAIFLDRELANAGTEDAGQ